MKNRKRLGHLCCIVSTVIWGTTSISAKILLEQLQPIQILLLRFVIGITVLSLIHPKRFFRHEGRGEIYYVLAGFFGICLYFYLDHVALLFTTAANMGVLSAVSPVITVILAQIFLKENGIHKWYVIGCVLSMVGVALFYINGARLKLNPLGDSIVMLGNLAWGFYIIFLKKIDRFKRDTLFVTRRVMVYGLLFLTLFFFVSGKRYEWSVVGDYRIIAHLLYLGIGASALCFIGWNFGIKVLGATKSSIYGYLGPVVTLTGSILILHERVTAMQIAGAVMILTGVILSERKVEKEIRDVEYN